MVSNDCKRLEWMSWTPLIGFNGESVIIIYLLQHCLETSKLDCLWNFWKNVRFSLQPKTLLVNSPWDTRVGPRRQQIMKTNIMSTPGHINHNLANSSTNVAINRPVADVIDLTSESDENEQIQCFCLNQIGSHPQATVDVAFLQHILQDLAVVSSSPEEVIICCETTWRQPHWYYTIRVMN